MNKPNSYSLIFKHILMFQLKDLENVPKYYKSLKNEAFFTNSRLYHNPSKPISGKQTKLINLKCKLQS